MRNRSPAVLASLALLWPSLALAGPESGPKPGTKVEPLTVFVAAGDQAGKTLDLTAEQKDRPTVYLFVQAENWARPTARFIKVLDQELTNGVPGGEDASAAVIWLTDDVAKGKEYLPVAQNSLKLDRTPWTVFEGSRFGPPGWAVNVDAYLTAVVVKNGKVAGTFGYISVNESDVPAVIEVLKKP
jgi:hypothetical protein